MASSNLELLKNPIHRRNILNAILFEAAQNPKISDSVTKILDKPEYQAYKLVGDQFNNETNIAENYKDFFT